MFIPKNFKKQVEDFKKELDSHLLTEIVTKRIREIKLGFVKKKYYLYLSIGHLYPEYGERHDVVAKNKSELRKIVYEKRSQYITELRNKGVSRAFEMALPYYFLEVYE